MQVEDISMTLRLTNCSHTTKITIVGWTPMMCWRNELVLAKAPSSSIFAQLGPKRLGLLHELVPNATIVALLVNPNNPESARQPAELQNAARAIGLQLILLTATTASDIDTAFTAMVQNRVGALLVGSDPFFANRREHCRT
jgi:hypothetical protein